MSESTALEAVAAGEDTAVTKVRGFVVDEATGNPLAGVPVALWVEVDQGVERPLGLLTSDVAGYLSFDVSGLSSRPVSYVLRSPRLEQAVRVLYGAVRPDRPCFVASARPVGRNGSPAVTSGLQNPDLVDLAISPQSFGVNTAAQPPGSCGGYAPSQAASRDLRVVRTVLTPDSVNDATWPEHPAGLRVDDVTALPGDYVLPRARLVRLRQQWWHIGATLGDLVYSLPLAPGETVQLATVEWNRADRLTRADDVRSVEHLHHDLTRDRTLSETIDASITESQNGYSLMGGTATSSSAGASLSLEELTGFPLDIAAGASGLISAAGSVAFSGGNRDVEADATQTLSDTIKQNAWATRSLNSTVVVQADQREDSTVQTRAVTNNNRCHALTIQYYEVLHTFRMETWRERTDVGVLIPYDDFAFTPDVALRHRLALETALSVPNLLPAFDALARVTITPEIYQTTGSTPATSEFAEGRHTVSVPVTDVVDTNLTIEQGSTIRLVATGNAKFGADVGPGYTPDGAGDAADSGYPAPGLRRLSLICRIGNAWHQGGVSADFTAMDQGTLILQANDYDLPNNSGTWSVTVNITRPAADTTTAPWQPPATGQLSRTSDEAAGKLLVRHLNDNSAFYSRAIWVLMDAAQRRALLEQFLAGNRWLLARIGDTPIATFGKWLVFPYVETADEAPDLNDHRRVELVSLPTRGLLAEAELGSCNACETRDVRRAMDWPLTQPTPITGVTPGPQGQTPAIPQPASLPSPVVAIQQAPAAPDPVGLAGALNLLGQPNLFRDMSGLQQVSQLLDDLVNGTVSETNAALRAASARAALRGSGADSSGGGTGGAPSRRSAPSTTDPSRQVDRLDAIQYALDQGQIDERQANDAAVGVLGGEVVPAMFAGTGGSGFVSSIVDDLVLAAAPQAKLPPLVSFDRARGSETSRRAYARMVTDDGSAQRQLLNQYIGDYGFDTSETPTIRGIGVREPYTGMEPIDFAAIDAVARAMNRLPAQVLGLWIYEGKSEHDPALHGGLIDPGVSFAPADAAALTSRFRPWLRSVILFQAFGSDRLTAFTRTAGDNALLGPDGPHAERFRDGLRNLQARDVPGIGAWTDANLTRVERYFTNVGGAFSANLATDIAGNVRPQARLTDDSLASWLWLQNALFDLFRQEQEAWFNTTYGGSIDLTTQPWVTYTYWNGGPNTRTWFTGAASSQEAIDRLFGSPNNAPAKLSADQLNRYYARGPYAAAGQSTAALANAVLVKYLVEAVEPWFA